MKNNICFEIITFCLAILLIGCDQKPNNVTLIIKEHTINIKGKDAKVYRIEQPDGTWGFRGVKGQQFNVIVENNIDKPTTIHWHGLTLPNDQDGVPHITQDPIQPGQKYHYNFKLKQAGTYWMHSHHDMLRQKLLSAPLIIDDVQKNTNEQEVIMFITDFSFKEPEEIWQGLHKSTARTSNDMEGMKMNGMDMTTHSAHNNHNMAMAGMTMAHDLNDVKYDVFLTNYKDITNPDVITVNANRNIRLRVINAASASNFFINLGTLKGEMIAVDGEDIIPIQGSKFELAMAQRIDIRVTVPIGDGSYPILAHGEGTSMQTGLVITTPNAKPTMLSETTNIEKALGYQQELSLKAVHPLAAKPINRTINVDLEGDMASYIWKLNGQTWPNISPLMVKEGERIEMVFNNKSGMSHPMHLHGHVFQVTEIDGKVIKGANRDTILVSPNSTVKVQFDANNSGIWMMHCHVLYHEIGGMMTTLNYEGFKRK